MRAITFKWSRLRRGGGVRQGADPGISWGGGGGLKFVSITCGLAGG